MLAPAQNAQSTPATANLAWLFVLRGFAITGQVLAVGTTLWVLDLQLPVSPISAIIGGLIVLNVFTWFRLRRASSVADDEFFLQLALDVLALTGLLYFTGGGTNPFTWLFLLPLSVAAAVLPRKHTWAMAAITTVCYTLLMVYYVPFPYPDIHQNAGFGLHVSGMWIGFVLCAAVVAYFLRAMAEAVRERDRNLTQAREQALRDERVVALGALAAGAAHELGTPLGTIAVLSKELEQEYPGDRFADLHPRLGILRDQADRCKKALSVISAAAGEPLVEGGGVMPVDAYLSALVERWRQHRIGVHIQYRLSGSDPSPQILAERTLTQAILSILDNAADASPDSVELDGEWNDAELVIDVGDRGQGVTGEAAERVGRTAFTTKPQGLGLGLFLAHAAIGRLGGRVSLTNREAGGARTRVTLPLASLLAGENR